MIEKAGCILVNKDTMKVALVYREERCDYSFPKGHVEDGESLVECAIRETEEETKRKVKLVMNDEICCENYSSYEGDVCVHYYLGIDDGVSLNDSNEVHELVWCDIDFVQDTLTYESTLDMFLEYKNVIIQKIWG